MSVPKEFPEASIAVSQSSGPDFQQRLIAGVDFSSGSGQSVTLTGDLGMSFAQTSPRGSSLQFHVMAVYLPVPIVTVDVAPGQVTEDGGQKLVYTFMRSIATASDLVVSYSVGGGAIAGDDYTGLPLGSGTQTITIPANQHSATLEILPTPDTLIEDDETVVITLQNGSGYTFDPNRSFATGTIENDDYLVDLDVDSDNTGTLDRSAQEDDIEDVSGGGKELVYGVPSDVTLAREEPQDTAEIIVSASPSNLSNGKQLRITADGGLNIWLNKEKTQPFGSHNTDPNQPDVFTFVNATFTGEQRLYVAGNFEGIDRTITLALIDSSGAVISEDRILLSVEEYIDVRPIEKLATLNNELGAALAGDALQYLTAAEYSALKDAGLEVGRHDGLWDYVFLKIGNNYYTYIEPTLPGFSYKLFAIAPDTVSITALRQGAEIANWLVGLGAIDVALSVIPGGTSAGYLEKGDYPYAALWFLADIGLTLSVVGKLGQVTAKAGSVVKSGTAIRLGKAINNAAKIGQYRHVALGGTIATGILGAESGVGAVSDVLNGRYTDATIKGIDAVFAALGSASLARQYRDALTDAAKANRKLAEKIDVQQVASKTAHTALSSGIIRQAVGSATTPLINNLSHIADDALVHLAPAAHSVVTPGAAGKIFTFRFGDIKHLTPIQVETIIGQLASAGQPGGAKILHVLDESLNNATKVDGPAGFFEYVLTKPSSVREGWIVQ
jgi:hypothetical protein